MSSPATARPRHEADLMAAARRYGDAKLAAERNPHPRETPEAVAIAREATEAQSALLSAARAHASATRRRAGTGEAC